MCLRHDNTFVETAPDMTRLLDLPVLGANHPATKVSITKTLI